MSENSNEQPTTTPINSSPQSEAPQDVAVGSGRRSVSRYADPFDALLLRALVDLPDFARQVIPAIDPEYFQDAAATIFTFMADAYTRHRVVPTFSVLRVHNQKEHAHTDRTVKAVDTLICELEAMAPLTASQMPLLITESESWIRDRKHYAALVRLVRADEEGVDLRPLIEQLTAADDWRFDGVPAGRYTFKTRDALMKSATAPFLVQNLIVQNSLVALVSPPGGNKTFLALDLALSIASGQSTWLGEPLHLSGPVVYVLGEGSGRFKLRVQAWEQHHGITSGYPFHVLNEPVALTNAADASTFVREVAAIKPVLIVFDTLSRCLAGADENNQKDMSAAVSVCDRLRQQLGCSVLLLHHTIKDGSVERGSSVLRGAVDTMLLLKASDLSARRFALTCDKQKDAEAFAAIALSREQVTLASERDPLTGDPIVSCVVKLATAAQVHQHADAQLWKAQQFMIANTGASRRALADHLGVRRTEAFKRIDEWVSLGKVHFRRGRTDPMATLTEIAGENAA